MKVFISWSGTLSHDLAEAISNWLPNVIQTVEPFFAPKDLDKGSQWLAELTKTLVEAKVGIICLTRNNITSDWILFESGALSKTLDTPRVCPILFDIKPTDLKGPLEQFQATRYEKSDFKNLVTVINKSQEGGGLPDKRMDQVFDTWWPQLETKIHDILSREEIPEEQLRTDREILEEVLQLTRSANLRNRSVNVRLVSPSAINSLLDAYIRLHDEEASETGDYQNTLNMLKSLHEPLLEIVEKNTRHNKSSIELIERFKGLSYEINPEEAEEEANEEEVEDKAVDEGK